MVIFNIDQQHRRCNRITIFVHFVAIFFLPQFNHLANVDADPTSYVTVCGETAAYTTARFDFWTRAQKWMSKKCLLVAYASFREWQIERAFGVYCLPLPMIRFCIIEMVTRIMSSGSEQGANGLGVVDDPGVSTRRCHKLHECVGGGGWGRYMKQLFEFYLP